MKLSKPQEELRDVLTMLRDFKISSGHGLAGKGFAYNGPEDFVLQHGEWFEPIPLPAEFEYGPPKTCFGTSIALAAMKGLTYVEGFAYWSGAGFPIPHAWNTDESGRLIDATWRAVHEATGVRLPMQGAAYLGLRFSLGRADDATWNGDGSILDDWQRRWPIFEQPWEGEDFEHEWPNPSPVLLAHKIENPEERYAALLEAYADMESEEVETCP